MPSMHSHQSITASYNPAMATLSCSSCSRVTASLAPQTKLSSSFQGSSCGRVAVRRSAALHGPASRSSRRGLAVRAAVSTAPPGQDIVSSLFGFFKKLLPSTPKTEEPDMDPDTKVGRKVAVVGATGATGKYVVTSLLDAGHTVTVLASSEDRAKEVLEAELGVQLNGQGKRSVRLVEGRIQDPDAVRALVQGADAVICCTGSRRGPDGYAPGMSPEDVDWRGVSEMVRVAAEEFASSEGSNPLAEGGRKALFDFSGCQEGQPTPPEAKGAFTDPPRFPASDFSEEDRLAGWRRSDDVIMGGQSESMAKAGNGFAVFEGTVRVEGGGFCGCAAPFESPVDASEYDGFCLRVRGDGKRYKMNTRDISMPPGELQYQASFDTVKGQWLDVFIPFSSFRAMRKATGVSDAAPLNLSALTGIQLLLSRFQFDGFPNPLFQAGKFRLEVASVSLERKPRTQFVLLSSAAVERSARAQTPEEREASIPIVKLNPSGVLSWKLSGEDALRASGLRYTIVRPTGLTDKDVEEKFVLESAQGDAITGLISRQETAAVCVEALESPFATNTTFEVRRDEYSKGLGMSPQRWESLFLRLRPDVRGAIVQYPAVPPELAALKE